MVKLPFGDLFNRHFGFDQLVILGRDGWYPILKIIHDLLVAHRSGNQEFFLQLFLVHLQAFLISLQQNLLGLHLVHDGFSEHLHIASLLMVGHINMLHLFANILRQIRLDLANKTDLRERGIPMVLLSSTRPPGVSHHPGC